MMTFPMVIVTIRHRAAPHGGTNPPLVVMFHRVARFASRIAPVAIRESPASVQKIGR